MAAAVKRLRGALPAALLALAAGTAGAAGGPALRDPTQPPAVAAAAAAAAATSAPPLRLQMVMRGPGAARRALIAGQGIADVAVGDVFDTGAGPARVLRITDASVLLARADGSAERLDLHPAAEGASTAVRKRSAARAPSARSGR